MLKCKHIFPLHSISSPLSVCYAYVGKQHIKSRCYITALPCNAHCPTHQSTVVTCVANKTSISCNNLF